MAVQSGPRLNRGLQPRSHQGTRSPPARPDVGSCAPRWLRESRAPRGVSQCSPQPRAPPSPGSAGSARGRPQSPPGSPARSRPADSRRLARFPAWAPGTRLGVGCGCGRAGRGAAPPRPEPPGAPGKGGPTGEHRTRVSSPGAPLGTPSGSCALWQEAERKRVGR